MFKIVNARKVPDFGSGVPKVQNHLDSTKLWYNSSSSSSRTDRWVHFQQNAGLRLFVRP